MHKITFAFVFAVWNICGFIPRQRFQEFMRLWMTAGNYLRRAKPHFLSQSWFRCVQLLRDIAPDVVHLHFNHSNMTHHCDRMPRFKVDFSSWEPTSFLVQCRTQAIVLRNYRKKTIHILFNIESFLLSASATECLYYWSLWKASLISYSLCNWILVWIWLLRNCRAKIHSVVKQGNGLALMLPRSWP